MSDLQYAKAGATFPVAVGSDPTPVQVELLPSCDNARGTWYCISHAEAPMSNWTRDMHDTDSYGVCLWAWVCIEHGPEEA